MSGSLRHLPGLAGVAFVLAREGVLGRVDPASAPALARLPLALARLIARRPRPGEDAADRLTNALTRLGPTYVKLGQFLATRPDVVGTGVARDLERLQDRVAPFPRDVAVATIEGSLGLPLGQLFAHLGEPVAAASIAQVHKATTADGAAVAVKVLRPGVARRLKRDMRLFYGAARLLQRFVPPARRLKPIEVADVLARSVALEMDLRLEAAALSEMRDNIARHAEPGFRVPAPLWNLTGDAVLTMEWVDGVPLSDRAGLVAAGHDLSRLGQEVIRSFLRHALRDGFFHADMHPGNLFADPNGDLVAVDFGIMGRLGPDERRFLAEILLGFIRRDYLRVAQVHFEAGYVPGHHRVEDFAQAVRAIGEPIHSRRADEISMARLLTLLFEVTALFDMRTRPELVMLQKTMVVVEGVARGLDPRLDMWTTAEPVVRAWVERNLGPVGQLERAAHGVGALIEAAARLPALVRRAEIVTGRLEAASERGLPLDPEVVVATAELQARRTKWAVAALWAIAGLLAWIAWRGL